MSKSSGSSKGATGNTSQVTNSVQTAEPWGPQIPYIQKLFDYALQNYSKPLEYYPGQTYAPMSADTEQSLGMQENRATAGSPLVSTAQGNMQQNLQGDFLSAGNPYFSDMVRQIGNTITPQMDAKFGGAGRYGSGAHANALTSALADETGKLAYQSYGDERTRQMQAAMFAPQLANQDYYDIAKLGEAGTARENWAQL